MSIKTRLTQIEQRLKSREGDFMMVCITDDNGHAVSCNQHREDCPEFPCNRSNCWAKKAYPDMEMVTVDNEEEGRDI